MHNKKPITFKLGYFIGILSVACITAVTMTALVAVTVKIIQAIFTWLF